MNMKMMYMDDKYAKGKDEQESVDIEIGINKVQSLDLGAKDGGGCCSTLRKAMELQ
jgi:hypothetical protein